MYVRPIVLSALMFATPLMAYADVVSDIRIGQDGVFTASNLTVVQKAGTTFFTRATWGTTYLRVGVLTDGSTSMTKAHGGTITAAEVSEGDLIDVTGRLVLSTEGVLVTASKVRNASLQSEDKSLSGTVTTLDVAGQSFTLKNATFGTSVVKTAGANITKGTRTILVGDIVKGDKITSVVGVYDFTKNTMNATAITVYQPKEIFVKKNFEGTLKSVAASVLPTTLTVAIGGNDYTVHLTEKTQVLKTSRATTGLNRFAAGDTVRIFGSVGDQSPLDIQAEVVRDMNF